MSAIILSYVDCWCILRSLIFLLYTSEAEKTVLRLCGRMYACELQPAIEIITRKAELLGFRECRWIFIINKIW